MACPTETLATVRAQIEQFAGEALAAHVVRVVSGGEGVRVYRCSRPGTSVYSFTVAVLPNTVVFYGDIGEAILRMHAGKRVQDTLEWLWGAVDSEGYLLEKVRPAPVETFYRADAHAWLDARAREMAESDVAFDDEADLRACLDDETCSPDEFARALSEAGLLDGRVPGMGPSSATLWMVEALRWFAQQKES
jgi:hypothetical protein